jgi:aspartyl-tRNA synthetase
VLRTKTCGELRASNVGQTATLCGWVEGYRDHGGLVFIDLRDRYGKTQVVFNPAEGAEMHEIARGLRSEDVIRATGNVVSRPADMINPKLATGEIDLRATNLEILNKSKTPPFEPSSTELPAEELRLRYRFIDLRRPSLQQALILRHKITLLTREYFDRQGFLEIETPMLGKSTPEGARDYLVPSRVHPGSFYALPQSPQIYKQILMVAGYDRYMQIARCFRDEDLRADRQPEFTQIDVEMAFVEREDILSVIDGLVSYVAEKITGQKVRLPLPRYSYHDVMERYGSDKPDLRFGMELVDLSDLAKTCGFNAFKAAVEKPQGRVRGLNVKAGAEKYSRKTIDELTQFVGQYGAKFFSEAEQREIIKRFGGESGDLLFLVADTNKSVTSAALAALRSRLGKELKLFDPKELKAAWVLDFPLVTYNEEEKRWDAEHHPFCYPVKEDVPYLESDPGRVRAQSYDLIVNGYEAASGSVRIHDAATQQKVFSLLGIAPEEAERRFGFLLEALRYGAPPHAGIALGLDRWVMLFCGNENIREVIAFPKTQKAADLLSGAPSPVDDKQLRELRIRVDLPK